MSYKELLEKHGSIRKAATAAGLTKSKFVTVYKKELGLCTGTTGCQNPCEPERTRCKEHLRYAVKTRDPIKKKISYKKWREDNFEMVKDRNKIYQKTHLSKWSNYRKTYSATPRGRAVNTAKRARRRAAKLQATPVWVDKIVLLEIYENCPQGYHVDHVLPLQNDQVCGLHVPSNLQYLSAFDNDSKGDSFDGTYENESWRSK